MWLSEAIEAAAVGTLDLDCPRMELAQRGGDPTRVFAGPGYVRQSIGGELEFKVYARAPAEHGDQAFDRMAMVRLDHGKLVPEGDYYRLTVYDLRGRKWEGDWVPNPGERWHDEEPGYKSVILTGSVRRLVHSTAEEVTGPGESLVLHFPGDLLVPYTADRQVEVTAAGRRESWSSSLDVAPFAACDCAFRVVRGDGSTRVEATHQASLPPHMETRIVEALQFVLAETHIPRVVDFLSGTRRDVAIQASAPARPHGLFKPPISRQDYIRAANDFWALFGRYLQFITGRSEESWHPCSRHLHFVGQAGHSGVHGLALALGVTVEGLLRTLFPADSPAVDRAEVEELRAYVRQWPSRPGSRLSVERLDGLIGQLMTASAAERLQHLASRGVIEGAKIGAWKQVRNAAAHGSEPEVRVEQGLIDNSFAATVLLYQLVFHAVGYAGQYTDYSSRGWRPARYPLASAGQKDVPRAAAAPPGEAGAGGSEGKAPGNLS